MPQSPAPGSQGQSAGSTQAGSQQQQQQQAAANPPSLGGYIFEEELLVFSLGDGRAGVLSVRGRVVADARAKRPMAGLMQVCGCDTVTL